MANFALFDLTGLTLSARIRDMGKLTLCRTGAKADFTDRYPHAGRLLTRRCNTELVRAHWGRSAAGGGVGQARSLHRGDGGRQVVLVETSAERPGRGDQGMGLLRRTLSVTRILADKALRRRIARQLNKGENVHTLRRDIFHAHEGAVRRRHHEQQTEQAWCLTIVANAVVTWMTEYFGLAVARKRARGEYVDDELLAHIWPTHHENVTFMGSIRLDIASELAELDATGHYARRNQGRKTTDGARKARKRRGRAT
jgi:hypothetical protein